MQHPRARASLGSPRTTISLLSPAKMSSNNSEGHTASPYDDKPAKGADGTVVNTVSRGDATGSVDVKAFQPISTKRSS